MEYKLNNKTNEYDTAHKGVDLYNTNQICNRCQRYLTGECNGQENGLFKPCTNKYCPKFKDRIYTQEQSNHEWHLKMFSDLTNKIKI